MPRTFTKAVLKAQPLFDAPLGSIHIKDLVLLVNRKENRLSDLWVGALFQGAAIGAVNDRSVEMFVNVVKRGMKIREARWNEGQPFLGPDGLVLTIQGMRLDGGNAALRDSPLDRKTLRSHPNYYAWLRNVLFAGLGSSTTCSSRKLPLPFSEGNDAVGPEDGVGLALVAPSIAPAMSTAASSSTAAAVAALNNSLRYPKPVTAGGSRKVEDSSSDSDDDFLVLPQDHRERVPTQAFLKSAAAKAIKDSESKSSDAGNDTGESNTATVPGNDEAEELEPALPSGLKRPTWYVPAPIPSVSGRMRLISSVKDEVSSVKDEVSSVKDEVSSATFPGNNEAEELEPALPSGLKRPTLHVPGPIPQLIALPQHPFRIPSVKKKVSSAKKEVSSAKED